MAKENKKEKKISMNFSIKLSAKELLKLKKETKNLRNYIISLLNTEESKIPNFEEIRKSNELVDEIKNEVIDFVFSQSIYYMTGIIGEKEFYDATNKFINTYFTFLAGQEKAINNQNNSTSSLSGPQPKDDDITYIR